MRLYTVHLKDADPSAPSKDPDTNMVLVGDGFCWGAFFFSSLWALYHRMWVVAVGLVLIYVASGWGLVALGAPYSARTVAHLLIPLAFGMAGAALRRQHLAGRGFRLAGGVAGANLADAEERYLLDAGLPPALRGTRS